MILILNKELVILEMVHLAKLKIAEALAVSWKDVQAKVELEDGKMKHYFSVEAVGDALPLERKLLQDTIAKIWTTIKPQLLARLKGVNEVRYGSWIKKTTEKEKTIEGATEAGTEND